MGIKLKELSKIGYTNNFPHNLALGIISKHCKHSTKEDLLVILKVLLENPEDYKTNEIWSKLAEHFSPTLVEKQFIVYNLLDRHKIRIASTTNTKTGSWMSNHLRHPS